MEHKQFISDALKRSPPANLSFQADKFTKKSNFLSIPDTIHEQASAELSGDSLKMEASNDLTKSFEFDEKENVNSNRKVMCNEPKNNSEIITIDNSFIKNCEKKLLENSNNDEERTIEFANKSAVNKQLLEIPSKLMPNNDTISTPPSALRKEISMLRSELAAADEFHDLEIRVLKEEKSINEVDIQNYLQVLEKNAALMELYTNLKSEYEEYRKEQEKIRHEFQSRTADCLESLCSQIEASDSSLNFSSTSFVSFNAGIRSSTMMEDISEIEATVMHDATVLANDPLSLTSDGAFKTPMQTPLRSAKKLFPQQMKLTSKMPIVKDVNEIINKHESTLPLDSEYNIQLLNLETALHDKVKEVESLEQRLFKVEDMANVLKSEWERSKEDLAKKTKQLNELTQKLFTETISLNPGLRDTLSDVSGSKLLLVFIETIMEKCKNIQDELITKHTCEKNEWEAQRKIDLTAIENLQNRNKSLNELLTCQNSRLTNLEDLTLDLQKKLSDAESTILTREVEMRILQTSIREAREDASSSAEAFLKLESQLSLWEVNKKEVENQCHELEETVRSLKDELEAKEKLIPELNFTKSTVANIQRENENLKQVIQQSETTIDQLRSELLQNKEGLTQEIEWLKNQEASRFSTLHQALKDCKKVMEDNPEYPLSEMSAFKLISEKLHECSDPQLLQAVEAIMEFTKVDWESRRKRDSEAIDNLQNQIKAINEKAIEGESRLSELLQEISNLSRLNESLQQRLCESETAIAIRDKEITTLKKEEELLEQLRGDFAVLDELETSHLPHDRIDTLITNRRGQWSSEGTGEGKIVSVFIETLTKTCKGVQNEFIKRIEHSKFEWESQRNVDLSLIDTLQTEIKILREKSNEQERQISEINQKKEDLIKLHENLRSQMTEAEDIISKCNEEICTLRCHEVTLKETREKLAVAEEAIVALKSQLTSTESVKVEMESQCQGLQETIAELKRELDSVTSLRSHMESDVKENAELSKLYDDIKHQLNETQNLLSLREEEMSILRKQEDVLIEMKGNIALADENIFKLNAQLSATEEKKKEVENRCRELEETVRSLKDELEAKEKLIPELNFTKSTVANIQRENENLKQVIQQSETTIDQLRSELLQNKEGLTQEIEWLKNQEASRFSTLHQALKDCKKVMEDNPEYPLSEMSAFKLISEKLHECSDPQLLQAVEDIMEFTKVDWESRRKRDSEAIDDLQNQIKAINEKAIEGESRLSELLQEISNLSRLNESLQQRLCESETAIAIRDKEITTLKKEEELLEQLRGDFAVLDELETSHLPHDRIDTLITNRRGQWSSEGTGEGKIVSVFIETLTKTCKGVQNEFIKKIEHSKFEWESQRNVDLSLIDTLQTEIKILREKSNEQERQISEINQKKEDLIKLHENLRSQMTEAEDIISKCNEEICTLRCHEVTLKETREKLAVAEETIVALKSQLTSTESQKIEIELRCRKLEEGTASLQAEIDSKEFILKGLDELKLTREKVEKENDDLKQRIMQSEDIILNLKKVLELAREEQNKKELRIKGLLNDIDVLKKEKENLMDLSVKLEKMERNNKGLMDIFSDVQSHLDLPEDTMTKLLSGNLENKKIFSEKMNNLVKAQTEGLRAENKSLKLGNENLKEKVKQLTKLLCETESVDIKEELSNMNASQGNIMTLRSRSSKNMDLCVRRLDKLEDINHNLMELLTRILTMMEFPDLEKLRLCSVRDFSNITKKVVAHINSFQSSVKELKEENATLDEECETYSNIIKDLKKEAAAVWRSNKEKTEAMELDISRLKEEKTLWEKERQEMLTKISKLESECQKLKSASKTEGPIHSCICGNESKKVNDLKRTILIKEQKLLELQDLEAQCSSYKSQIEYLKSALEREKKKVLEEPVGDEKDRNKKLQNELNETTKKQKPESKKEDQNEILDELRMRGSLSGGVVQEFVDKEKMRKLSKDIAILKELCRARYVEIKRLEAVNTSLRNKMPKNSNQIDSPIRPRGYNTRSKNSIRDIWKTESSGKENTPVQAKLLL